MARKKAASASEAQPAKPAGKAGGRTTLQQDEAAASSTRRAPALKRRRSQDDKVERAINLHFGHLPKVVREEKRVEGQTLREKVSADMAEADLVGGRLGTRYWQELQQLYASSVDPTHVLQVSNRDEPISEALIAALEHFDATNPQERTSEPLLAWLQTSPKVNQREFIGLLKACSKDAVKGRTTSDNVLLSLLKFIGSSKLQDKFPEEVKAILPLVDPILVRHFLMLKRSGVQVSTYLQCHMDVVCLLLDRSDLEAVLANRDGWAAVEPQLCRLAQCTQLGRALFTSSLSALEATNFSRRVAAALTELELSITEATINKYRKQCMQAAAEQKDNKQGKGNKMIKVQFCGHSLEVMATSPTHEWQLHLHALLKQTALQSKQLRPLVYEAWTIQPVWLKGGSQEVPKDMLEDYITARTLVSEMLNDRHLDSFAGMQQLISANAINILAIDRSFELELVLLSKAEPLLEVYVKTKVLEILPGEGAQKTIKQSRLEMEELAKSDCCQKAGTAVVCLVEGYIELLAGLEKGICPNSDPASSSQFYAKVLQACEWFCKYEYKDEKGKPTEQAPAYGVQALDLHRKDLASRFADAALAASVTLADLEVLQTFKWKLSEQHKQDLASWVKLVLQQGSSSALVLHQFVGQGSSTNSRPKKGGNKSQGSGAPQLSSGVMKFF
jgi:hypothetical protein